MISLELMIDEIFHDMDIYLWRSLFSWVWTTRFRFCLYCVVAFVKNDYSSRLQVMLHRLLLHSGVPFLFVVKYLRCS